MAKEIGAVELQKLIHDLGARESAEESPRLKCLLKCQSDHNSCLAAAGNDDAKKKACDKRLNECIQLCPQN